MVTALADIETDGFKPSKVHCMSILICETGKVYEFADQPGPYNRLADGYKLLEAADIVGGHNFMAFDRRVLNKLYGVEIDKDKVFDTLLASRLMWPDLMDADKAEGKLSGKLLGSHSLEAWGVRLGTLKGSYGKTTNWRQWSPQMSEYCSQDVNVLAALYLHLLESVEAA